MVSMNTTRVLGGGGPPVARRGRLRPTSSVGRGLRPRRAEGVGAGYGDTIPHCARTERYMDCAVRLCVVRGSDMSREKVAGLY